ncbi:MAG TPA: hypothetical protein VGC26_12070 [Afipia sp.]
MTDDGEVIPIDVLELSSRRLLKIELCRSELHRKSVRLTVKDARSSYFLPVPLHHVPDLIKNLQVAHGEAVVRGWIDA